MPSVSTRQHNYMEMIAHGGTPRKGGGPSRAVAREFVEADKGKHFKKAVGERLAKSKTSGRDDGG